MKDHYHRLFQSLPRNTLSSEVFETLSKEIALLEKRAVIIRRVLIAFVSFIFLCAFIPSLNFLVTQFSESTFFSYASLLLSDWDLVLLHSQEFLFSLIESFPILGITFALLLVFLLLSAVKFTTQKSREVAEFLSTRIA